MDIIGAIEARRSIRRFKADPVPRQTIERLLDLATKAPSAKNAQPWSFIVLEGEKKNAVAGLLADAVVKYEAQGFPTGSAGPTARIMAEAPVLILVYDRYWIPGEGPPPPAARRGLPGRRPGQPRTGPRRHPVHRGGHREPGPRGPGLRPRHPLDRRRLVHRRPD